MAARDTVGVQRAAGGRPTVLRCCSDCAHPVVGRAARRRWRAAPRTLRRRRALASSAGLVDGDGAAAAAAGRRADRTLPPRSFAAVLTPSLCCDCDAHLSSAELTSPSHPRSLTPLSCCRWLRLLVATLRPYLRQLAQWVCTGWLPPSFAQLPSAPPRRRRKADSEAYWSDSFTQRAPEAIPTALRPLAAQLTLAGKTREFLGRLPPSGLADANATTGGVAGGAPGAASLEAAFYLRMLEAVRAAADGAKVPRTRAEEAAAHIRGPTPTASRGAVAVGAATWTPDIPCCLGLGATLWRRQWRRRWRWRCRAGETEDGHGPSAMRSSTGLHLLAPAPRARGADEHLAAAASSLCALSPSAAASSDGDCVGQVAPGQRPATLRARGVVPNSTGAAVRRPAGWAAQGSGGTHSSTRAFFAAKEVCSQQPPPCPPSPAPSLPRRLPPLPMLLSTACWRR